MPHLEGTGLSSSNTRRVAGAVLAARPIWMLESALVRHAARVGWRADMIFIVQA
jgi:hypothetical protein